MLKKLFGGTQKEGFFLDLGDTQSAPAPEAAPAETPAPAPIVEPEPVAAAPVAATPVAAVTEAPAEAPAPEPVSVNFATTYLQPSDQGAPRRRPSANMSGFLDMARNVRG